MKLNDNNSNYSIKYKLYNNISDIMYAVNIIISKISIFKFQLIVFNDMNIILLINMICPSHELFMNSCMTGLIEPLFTFICCLIGNIQEQITGRTEYLCYHTSDELFLRNKSLKSLKNLHSCI